MWERRNRRRVVPRGTFAQLRLAEPVVAARGDHVICAPRRRSAGGTVLDPRRPGGSSRSGSQVLDKGTPAEIVPPSSTRRSAGASSRRAGCSSRGARRGARGDARGRRALLLGGVARGAARGVRRAADGRSWRRTRSIQASRSRSSCPRSRGRRYVANLLGVERRGAKVICPGARRASASARRRRPSSRQQLEQEGIGKLDDRQLGAFLEERGRLRRVGDGFAVSNDLYDRGRELLATLDPITLAAFRDALGVGRRTAQLCSSATTPTADAPARRHPHAAPLGGPEPGLLGWPPWSGTGPVAQPVFKTGEVWQPHAGSVRLRGRSVRRDP